MVASVSLSSARRSLFSFTPQLEVACFRGTRLRTLAAGGCDSPCARLLGAVQMFNLVPKHRVALRNAIGEVQINLGHRQRIYWHPDQPLRPDRYLEAAATHLWLPFPPSEDGNFATGLDYRPAHGPLTARYRENLSVNLTPIGFVRILTP